MKFLSRPHKTALHMAVEKENLEIIKLLISHRYIDVEYRYILIKKFL